MPSVKADIAPKLIKTAKSFETWLKTHHATSDGLWLQIAKKGADERSVTYARGGGGRALLGLDRRPEKRR